MSQKTKKLIRNLEKYLALIILLGGFVYLYPHRNEPQISVKTGEVFIIMELAALEIWEVLKIVNKTIEK